MTIISYPSKPIHVFDSPEVESVDVKFYYNFFTPDEKINESGNEALDGKLPQEFRRKNSSTFKSFKARSPRFNIINVSMSNPTGALSGYLGSVPSALTATKRELEEALSSGLVVTETNATSKTYTAVTLGDSMIDDEMENLMRLALNKHVVDGESPSSAIDALSDETKVKAEMLSRMLPPSLNDNESLDRHIRMSLQEGGIDRNRSQVQLNTLYAPMILRKSVERGTSLLDGYINSNYLASSSEIKGSSVLMSAYGGTPSIGEDRTVFNLPFFRAPVALSPDSQAQPASSVVGALIEKTRILNGVRYKMPSIIVAGQRFEKIVDTKIAYGQVYEYNVRVLSIFRVPITLADGTRLLATYLIASKMSQPVQAVTTENVAPNPPSDVQYFYNYSDDSLTIFWRPPVNPQNDVKYYQVFRRKNLSEPFQLIAMLDFDDSIIRTIPKERIDPGLVIASPFPVYTFSDTEFDREGDYIYAVVSVDARQLSSLYSSQHRVTFDKSKNKIKKQLVCRQGSPKQYPNWTKKENFFVDTMKDSAHQKVRIYFDPETYTVIDKSGVSSPLFFAKSHDRLAKYVFQFINTDRLLEQRFEIKIDDTPFVEGDIGYESDPQGISRRATMRAATAINPPVHPSFTRLQT